MAAWLFSENTFTYLKATGKVSIDTLFLVLMSLFIAVPMLNMTTAINSQLDLPVWLHGLETKIKALENSAARLTQLFLVSDSYSDLALNFLMIAILPALGEEFIFRGVLQRLFIDWTKNSNMRCNIGGFYIQFYSFPVLWIHSQVFAGFVFRIPVGVEFFNLGSGNRPSD